MSNTTMALYAYNRPDEIHIFKKSGSKRCFISSRGNTISVPMEIGKRIADMIESMEG